MMNVKFAPCGHKVEVPIHSESVSIPAFCPSCIKQPSFSRGPWFTEKETGRVVMYRDDQVIPVCAVGDYVNEHFNRALIAAAPDLYEACERALKEAQETDDGESVCLSVGLFEDIAYALAKARGEAGGLPRSVGKVGLTDGLCLECGQGAHHCVCPVEGR